MSTEGEELRQWRTRIYKLLGEGGRPPTRHEILRKLGSPRGTKLAMAKTILREFTEQGLLGKRAATRSGARNRPDYPPVGVITVTRRDGDGNWLACLSRQAPGGNADEAGAEFRLAGRMLRDMAAGDRILARLAVHAGSRTAEPIRRLDTGSSRPNLTAGVFYGEGKGGRVSPITRAPRPDLPVAPESCEADRGGGTPDDGELVLAEWNDPPRTGPRRWNPPAARIIERLGPATGGRAYAAIARARLGIPHVFPDQVILEAQKAGALPEEEAAERTDLRHISLVTVDGEDARDHDDAVWACADPAPDNPDGWEIIVAIADVAWYVRPGSALDKEARRRGNSVYFPDHAIPMLPENLSSNWCSLLPGRDRGCLALRARIDRKGRVLAYRFMRAIMRSAARLTYTQLQRAWDGALDDIPKQAQAPVAALHGAYQALRCERERRGGLELSLGEPMIVLDEAGQLERFAERSNHETHRMIEAFMVLANVCAGETLAKARCPCLYRVHDRPDPAKIAFLVETVRALGERGLRLSPDQAHTTSALNKLVANGWKGENGHLIQLLILRAQAQAVYSPVNAGHFGLGLPIYTHFTSPIRRYSDLLTHRSLISALQLGEGGFDEARGPDDGAGDLGELGRELSVCERRAMAAERDVLACWAAQSMTGNIGEPFAGRVLGLSRAGLFLAITDHIEGFLPRSRLGGHRHVHFNPDDQSLKMGRRTWRLGDSVPVRLEKVDPLAGNILLSLQTDHPSPPGKRRS